MDLLPLGGPEPSDGSLGGASNVTCQERHRARSKGRGNGPALVLPVLALAEQQTVAEQRAQHPYRGRCAAIIFGFLDEDMVDPFGPIENDLPAAEKAAKDHVLLEGLRRKGQERVIAQCPGNHPRRGGAGRGARGRWTKRLWLGPSADPVLTIRYGKDRDSADGFQHRVMSSGRLVPASVGAAAPAWRART